MTEKDFDFKKIAPLVSNDLFKFVNDEIKVIIEKICNENSLDFKTDKSNALDGAGNGLADARVSLSDAEYFKSVKGDLKAIRDDVNDYLRGSVWRSDSKLTLNGLIDLRLRLQS